MDQRSALFPVLLLIALLMPLLAGAQPTLQHISLGDGATSRTLAQRIEAGQALHVVIRMEEKEILDPTSVRAAWMGQPLPFSLFSIVPTHAIVFIAPPEGPKGVGAFTVEARQLEDDRLVILRDIIEVREIVPKPRKGRTVRLMDPVGGPFPRASVFGQQRGDLFALADEEGVVVLDAPARGTPDPHRASAPAMWVTPFDPVTSAVVTLEPLPWGLDPTTWLDEKAVDPKAPRATVVVRDEEGKPLAGAVVGVNRTYWARTDEEGRAVVVLPEFLKETLVLVHARGFESLGSATLAPGETETVLMEKEVENPPRPE